VEAGALRDKLAGVFVPISTPFRDNEDVDYDALRFNLERYAGSGVLGYLALGSNGENRSLTEEEKLRALDAIVRYKGARQVVMAGATYDAQRDTERFLEQAAGLGADFGLVLSPGYFRKQMTDEVLYRYFSTLAGASPLPLLLYNAPGFCGVTMSPALVERLAGHASRSLVSDVGLNRRPNLRMSGCAADLRCSHNATTIKCEEPASKGGSP
jgi:4-hydroxy-2-oxoglutarate aldolase